MADFHGVIIEESLADTSLSDTVHIVSTEIEKVKDTHKTPWLSQWTLHSIEIPQNKARGIANAVAHALETAHTWYADFTNGREVYVIFPGKVFWYEKGDAKISKKMVAYGVSLGIPSYQLLENNRLF